MKNDNPTLTIVRHFNGHVNASGVDIPCVNDQSPRSIEGGRDVHRFSVVNQITNFVVRGRDSHNLLYKELGLATSDVELLLKDPKYSWFGVIVVKGDAGEVTMLYHSEYKDLVDGIVDAIAFELHLMADGVAKYENDDLYKRFHRHVHVWSMDQAYVKDGGEGDEEG